MLRPGGRAFQAKTKQNAKAQKQTGLESRNGPQAKVTGEGGRKEGGV